MIRRGALVLAAALVVCSVALASAGSESAITFQSSGNVHTSEYLSALRGIVGICESYEANGRFSVASLRRLKNAGHTSIDVMYWWQEFENADGTYNQAYFDIMDQIVSNCEQTGMKLYLNHRTTWGTPFSDPPYTTQWLNYWDGARNGIADVFNPTGSILPRLVAFHEYMAQRYGASSAVAGFAIENYPFHQNENAPTSMQNAYYNYGVPQIFQAYRRHTQKTIMVAPATYKGLFTVYDTNGYTDTTPFDSMPSPTTLGLDSNIMILLDAYSGLIMAGSNYLNVNPAYTITSLRASFARARNYHTQYNVPIMIDEFGARNSGTTIGLQYVHDIISVFREFTDSWMFGMAGTLLSASDGSIVNQSLFDLLSTEYQT